MMKITKKILSTFVLLLIGTIFAGNAASAQVVKIDEANFPDETVRKALNKLSDDFYNDEYYINYGLIKFKVEPGYINTDDVRTFYIYPEYGTVTSLKGLEMFHDLRHLDIGKFAGSSISLPNDFKDADGASGIYIHNTTAKAIDVNLPNAICTLDFENYGTQTLNINAPKITQLDIDGKNKLNTVNVISIAGLEYFDMANTNCTSINLSNCRKLKWISINETKISSIKGLNQLENLKTLWVCDNKLKKLNLSSNNKLELINCIGNEITSLTAPGSVTDIYCDKNKLTSLNVSKCKKLESLSASDNKLNGKKLNLKNNTKLVSLELFGNKKLTSINLTKNKKLEYLDVSNTNLRSLNLKNNKKLKYISFDKTKIKKLDLTKYKSLRIYFNVKKGNTINLKSFLGTGYKCTKKPSCIKYDKKKNSITVVKKGKRDEEFVVLKKGKKKYEISLYFK